ncbi:type I glyceraldehyde-3-phosphate dehydrogenase [Candidatus Palauibacter sp.]|uniref:type I glyceraldehyde-3-phosphate dehydrogenase n=1 Tax=Candidatus Palauibacter sp. TaxID=3101350 RepID=UPI003B023B76
MSVRVAINGFGRIGRNILRAALENPRGDLDFVAINDLTDAATLAHLFKYDSVHGRFAGDVRVDGRDLVAGDTRVRVLSERDPIDLPWSELEVDVVIDSTGIFRRREDAVRHIAAGAKKVIISAPGIEPDITLVLGVNADEYDPDSHDVISNASCTTNCIAPVVKVLLDEFGFERGLMTTVHAYTNGQRLLDLQHKDLRRARAAALSIIPTTTGAAKAVGLVLPQVQGKLDGMAMRVPTPDVSIVDLVATVSRETTAAEINEVFRAAAGGPLDGVLEYTEEPLVSVDFTGHPASAIIDAQSTSVMDGTLVKVISWYDNEWGYSNRCVDLASFVGERLPAAVGA